MEGIDSEADLGVEVMEWHPHGANLVGVGGVDVFLILGGKEILVFAFGVAMHLRDHIGFGDVVGDGAIGLAGLYESVMDGLVVVRSVDLERLIVERDGRRFCRIRSDGVEAVREAAEVPVALILSWHLGIVPMSADVAVPGGAGGLVFDVVFLHHRLLIAGVVELVGRDHESGGEQRRTVGAAGGTCLSFVVLHPACEAHDVGADGFDLLDFLDDGALGAGAESQHGDGSQGFPSSDLRLSAVSMSAIHEHLLFCFLYERGQYRTAKPSRVYYI